MAKNKKGISILSNINVSIKKNINRTFSVNIDGKTVLVGFLVFQLLKKFFGFKLSQDILLAIFEYLCR